MSSVTNKRSSARKSSLKKVLLKIAQNSQENNCAGDSCRLSAYNFIKKETPTQVFSCEFCEFFNNTYFIKHLRTAGSEMIQETADYSNTDKTIFCE